MEDIVPELYKNIKNEFEALVSSDEEIQAFLNGKFEEASFADTSLLARRLGDYAAESLNKYFTVENLPDGKLYWNIMERTVVPLMYEVYELVFKMDYNVQKARDKKNKIGLRPLKAEFPLERIEAVMNKVSSIYSSEED